MTPIRISVLEEEPLVRQALRKLLPSFGIEVVGEYGDPSSFLVALLRDVPKVVVADCFQAPDPMALLRDIRERHPQVPLVVLTSARKAAADKCIEAGAAAFLDKAFVDAQAVASVVTQVADGNRLCPFDAFKIGPSATQGEEPELVRLLSPREREVLGHVAVGEDNLKISVSLGISERTVKAHVCNLYRKLGQGNRTQMALFARQLGLRPATFRPVVGAPRGSDEARQQLPS